MPEPVAKPVTTFPRSYVVERIEARMASLKSRVKQAEAETVALLANQARSDRAWLSGFAGKAEAIKEQVTAAVPLNDDELVQKANQIVSQLDKMSTRPTRNYQEQDRLRFLIGQAKEFEREIEALEHAVAYLSGTPIEQFSITSLRQLGLLDVVKFSLEITVKK